MGRAIRQYLLWQLPGWTLVALVLTALNALAGLPGWAVAVGLALVVVKDVLLFPVIRQTWRPSRPAHGLLGARGRTVEPLAPAGYVRVNGELWRARTRDGGPPIPCGRDVVIRGARGLTLVVDEPTESRP